MSKTLKQVLKMCEENGVRMVDFKMTDLDGRWRHLSIPVERLTDDTMEYGIGFDGSNYGYAPIESSDMVFVPDLDTAVIDPFAITPTLTMIGDVMVIDKPNNRPFDQYPRNVAKRAVEYMKETGIADEMVIGPEYEFYIFDNVEYGNTQDESYYAIDACQAAWSVDNNGYQVPHGKGYHSDVPLDVNQELRNNICLKMQDWGIDVKYHHTEVGPCGQLEIEVELGEMTKMADNTMTAKYIIKNEAAEELKTATFMPKPIAGEAGSGMHVHMLLKKGGQPVFYDEKGYAGLSQEALWFIGGLLTHASSLCAITNPSTNSYKRLIPGFEAPVTIGYAMSNRSAVVRIPAYAKSPNAKRFELRNPDATCNPYYAYAAILMAGLDGIKKKIDPEKAGWGPYDFNLYTLSDEEKAKIDSLPKTLDEALDALEADHDYLTEGGVFPERLLNIWVEKKRQEASEINSAPNPAEYAKYYTL